MSELKLKYSFSKLFLASILLLSSQAALSIPDQIRARVNMGVGRFKTDKGSLVISQFETDLLRGSERSTESTPGGGITYRVKMHEFLPDVWLTNIIQEVSINADAYYMDVNRSGSVLLFGSPTFNNYTYNMDIESSRAMLDLELTTGALWHGISIFINGGAGRAKNELDYKERPVPGITGNAIGTKSNSNYCTVYDAGGGIKYVVDENVEIALRYLYSHLGDAKSSTQGDVTLLRPLKVKLRDQSLFFTLSYLVN